MSGTFLTEKHRRRNITGMIQSKLLWRYFCFKFYFRSFCRLQRIQHKLGAWLATTSTPIRVVEEPAFVEFVRELNPKFPMPGRKGASKCVNEVYEKLKLGIS